MKMKDLCADDRPREKALEKGVQALSNAELLAIILRTGTSRMNVVDLARELLKSAGGHINDVAGLSVDGLCSIDGIGRSKAVTIAAAFELGRRSVAEPVVRNRAAVASPKSVFRIMHPQMRGLDHEECWALFLNRANYVLGRERMSVGGLDSTVLDSQAILRRALEKKASGVILVHNHPSGSALPGQADISQTGNLKKALQICGIQLVDHLIIGEDCWYSFADEQLVNEKF